eukprot:2652050-Amphidinium_carterae.1
MGQNIDAKLLAKVRNAAAATLEDAVPTSKQATPHYSVCRFLPLSNTFLNFVDNSEAHLLHKRRSRSMTSLMSIGHGTCTRRGMDGTPEQNGSVKTPMASMCNDVRTSSAEASAGISDSHEAETEPNDRTEPQFTTIMLRNLPTNFRQIDLLDAMNKCGSVSYTHLTLPTILLV